MKINKKFKTMMIFIIAGIMVLPYTGFSASAELTGMTENLCKHHAKHTSECGYKEELVEQPCTHKHTDDCQQETCIHIHNEGCGYVEAKGGLPCVYECKECLVGESKVCLLSKDCTLENKHKDECILKQSIYKTSDNTVIVADINYTLNSDDHTAQVTGGKVVSNGNLIIPATITVENQSYRVTSIADKAFEGKAIESTLKLSEGLLSIGEKAFSNFFGTGTLTIPNSVTEIGQEAFAGGLYSKIIVGNGILVLPRMVFGFVLSMDGLGTDVDLGSKIQTIDSTAFSGVEIKKLTVYSSPEVIENVAELKSAKEINYVDSVYDSTWLQDLIMKAPDNKTTEIIIDKTVHIEKAITVPKEKDIVLKDNGKNQNLLSKCSEMFVVSGKLTFDSTSKENCLHFVGANKGKSNAGNIMRIETGGKFYLKDGVLRDGTTSGNYSGAVYVKTGAEFVMSGGVIKNFTINGSVLCGTVNVRDGGSFNMTGGIIQDNLTKPKSNSGGGVLLWTWGSGIPAKMTMSGDALITGNKSPNGGGVYLVGNTNFVMNDGTISDNKAYSGFGGGVCASGTGTGVNQGGSPDSKSLFKMQGGTISGNYSSNAGGGIYVSEPPQVLQVYDALITENTATVMGGGLWFCPTGDATLAVTNGSAVYGNTALGEGNPAAGDDFVCTGGHEGIVTLADRMLGGGAVEWYQDGYVKGNSGGGIVPPSTIIGTVDPSVPRFDANNPGERFHIINSDNSHALKAVISDSAKSLAKSKAKLFITENTAAHGGGIGSNGAVIIGTPEDDHTLKVKKEWSQNTPESQKVELTIYLKVGEYQLDAVILNEKNNWTAEFTQLPNPDSLDGIQYAVVETPVPENFSPVYQEAIIEGNTILITVTNQYNEPKVGNLKVSKIVTGNNVNVNEEFEFIVTLSDRSLNGTYGDMIFKDGVSTFTLKHGESKTAMQLPEGIDYVVTESNNTNYSVTVTGSEGTIKDGITANVIFNNYRASHHEAENNEKPKPENSSEFVDDGLKTGDKTDVLLLSSIVGILSIVIFTALIVPIYTKKAWKKARHKK